MGVPKTPKMVIFRHFEADSQGEPKPPKNIEKGGVFFPLKPLYNWPSEPRSFLVQYYSIFPVFLWFWRGSKFIDFRSIKIDRGGSSISFQIHYWRLYKCFTGIHVKKSVLRSCRFVYTFSSTSKPHPTQVPYIMELNPTSWDTPIWDSSPCLRSPTRKHVYGTTWYKTLTLYMYTREQSQKNTRRHLERNSGSPLKHKK